MLFKVSPRVDMVSVTLFVSIPGNKIPKSKNIAVPALCVKCCNRHHRMNTKYVYMGSKLERISLWENLDGIITCKREGHA